MPHQKSSEGTAQGHSFSPEEAFPASFQFVDKNKAILSLVEYTLICTGFFHNFFPLLFLKLELNELQNLNALLLYLNALLLSVGFLAALKVLD